MSELKVMHGFAIQHPDGKVQLRPTRGSGGWSIWKTRRNAQSSIFNGSPAKVIPVTMRLELRQEIDTQEVDDAVVSDED